MGSRKRATGLHGPFKRGEWVSMYPAEPDAPTGAHVRVLIMRRNAHGLYRVMDEAGRMHFARSRQLARQGELFE